MAVYKNDICKRGHDKSVVGVYSYPGSPGRRCKACFSATAAEKYVLKLCKRYGLTLEQFKALPKKCGICESTNPKSHGGDFHMDHDHKTGKFRGVLCGPCNLALGLIKDRPEVAERMAAWLR